MQQILLTNVGACITHVYRRQIKKLKVNNTILNRHEPTAPK